MTQTLRSRRPPGYLLIEMLVIIGILSIAIFVEIRIYRASIGVIQTEPQTQKGLIAINHLTKQLRKDVWNARSIAVAEAEFVTLDLPDDRKVVWSFAQAQVTRVDESAEPEMQRRTYAIPIALRARVEGPRLILAAATDATSQSEQIFTSQLMIGGGAQ